MNITASEPDCNVPMDTVADLHQLREVVTGINGLLTHPHRAEAVSAARAAAREAAAICDRVCAHIDAVAAMQMQRQRAERDLKLAQTKIAAVASGSVRP